MLEIVAKGKDANQYADNTTVELARTIIETAQAGNANDKVLGAVRLPDGWVAWTALLAAMRVVFHSLPEEEHKAKQTLRS